MGSTRVLLVRHTDVQNPKNVFYGRLPRFGLSALGCEQAECAAKHLSALPISAIYSSPLLRARQTARVIARYHPSATFQASSLLLEVRTSWQGTSFDVLGRYVNIYDPRRAVDDETISDVFERVRRLLMRVVGHHAGETVVCVSHADPIMILRVGMQGLELTVPSIRGANYPSKGSITEFEFASGRLSPEIRYIDVLGPAPAHTVAATRP